MPKYLVMDGVTGKTALRVSGIDKIAIVESETPTKALEILEKGPEALTKVLMDEDSMLIRVDTPE